MHAAAVNPFDWKVREGQAKAYMPLTFPATIGGDFAGVVSALGPTVAGFAIGDEVYGQAQASSGHGAFAEFAARISLFKSPLGVSLRRARLLPRAQWGMAFAHGGLGILVAGLVGMTAWQSELVTALKEGESATVADYTLTLEKVGLRQGPNYEALVGIIRVKKDGKDLGFMMPEKRRFPVERQEKTEAAIRTNGMSDLYVVIGDDNGHGGYTVRAYVNPFAPWIWGGAIIMAFGGLVSLSDRRYRVGAPTRARSRPQAQPAE